MPNIKDQFHTIANWHNKIMILAGCKKEFLKDKPLTALTPEELKAQQEDLISLLAKIEANVMAIDEKIKEIKDFIYKKIGPDINL